jgi:hypothetical protein
MLKLLDYPVVFSLLCLLVMWLAARLGGSFPNREKHLERVRADYGVVFGASLTLLGLIIGFTFSMAVGRYDQRKSLEEEEANAIGTEYVRADLLPKPEAQNVRVLLREYLNQRIRFYNTRNLGIAELGQLNTSTAQLQAKLWPAVTVPASAAPTPLITLTVSGMNDVLNSQGYTDAAWKNRIPPSAWALMLSIALFCNLLAGYGSHKSHSLLLLVLPLLVSISFLLIADIDSPRGGLIRVKSDNLTSLAQSLQNG